MSCNNCYNGCVQTTSDKCVKYTGIDVPQLGIIKGDSLNVVLLKITNDITSTPATTTTTTTLSPTPGMVWRYAITSYSCNDCSFVNTREIINSQPLTLGKWYSYENVKFVINSFINSYMGIPLYYVLDSSKQDTCNAVVCPPTTTTTTTVLPTTTSTTTIPVTTTSTTTAVITTTTTTTLTPTTTTTTTLTPTTTTTTTTIY